MQQRYNNLLIVRSDLPERCVGCDEQYLPERRSGSSHSQDQKFGCKCLVLGVNSLSSTRVFFVVESSSIIMRRRPVHVKTARNFPYNQSYSIYYKLQCTLCIKNVQVMHCM